MSELTSQVLAEALKRVGPASPDAKIAHVKTNPQLKSQEVENFNSVVERRVNAHEVAQAAEAGVVDLTIAHKALRGETIKK